MSLIVVHRSWTISHYTDTIICSNFGNTPGYDISLAGASCFVSTQPMASEILIRIKRRSRLRWDSNPQPPD